MQKTICEVLLAGAGLTIPPALGPSARAQDPRPTSPPMIMRLLVLAAWLCAPGLARAQGQMVVEFYHLDAQGNVLALTDANGNLVESHDYDAFGQEVNPQPGTQAKRFTGKERDPETGWDYFGARYYGSKIGRFTTVDPALDLKAALVSPQKWNRYAYVSNNPLRYVDPDGREQTVILGGRTYMGGVDNMPAGSQRAQNQVFGALVAGTASIALGMGGPALMMEGQIAAGTCGASPGCQNAVRGFAEGVSGAPPGAMGAVPVLAGATKGALLQEAIGHVRKLPGTAAQKGDMFESLAGQIGSKFEDFSATRLTGADGSQIFVGRQGETFVIDSGGALFRGRASGGLVPAGGTSVRPNYDALKKLE